MGMRLAAGKSSQYLSRELHGSPVSLYIGNESAGAATGSGRTVPSVPREGATTESEIWFSLIEQYSIENGQGLLSSRVGKWYIK